jgi:HD-like signal output (HDOD) protein
MLLEVGSEFYNEVYDDLQAQMEKLASDMPTLVASLSESTRYRENINSLFRMVHNLKSLISYLKIENALKLVVHTEDVLNVLRNRESMSDNPKLHLWFELVGDLFDKWQNELSLRQRTLTPPDPKIFTLLKVKAPKAHPKKVLAPLKVMVVATDLAFLEAITRGISPFVKRCYYSQQLEDAVSFYKEEHPDIVICDYQLDGTHTGIDLFKRISVANTPLPFIMLAKNEPKVLRKIALFGITLLRHPINLKALVYELIETGRIHYGKQRLKVNSPTIQKHIEQLKPLPDSIRKVITACDSEESDIRSITQIVKDDPILSALVIKEANSPLYNQQATTIDRAVSFFGKRIVKALSLSLSTKLLEPIDLKAYGITTEVFTDVAKMRLALMMVWYAKVDVSKLTVLASVAMIASLGQVIIARTVDERNLTLMFQKLLGELTSCEAEDKLLGITTPEVTADILKYWNFDQTTIDAVRYTYEPGFCPEETLSYALASHIVCSVIPYNATEIPKAISPEIIEVMEKHHIDTALLVKALERLQP